MGLVCPYTSLNDHTPWYLDNLESFECPIAQGITTIPLLRLLSSGSRVKARERKRIPTSFRWLVREGAAKSFGLISCLRFGPQSAWMNNQSLKEAYHWSI